MGGVSGWVVIPETWIDPKQNLKSQCQADYGAHQKCDHRKKHEYRNFEKAVNDKQPQVDRCTGYCSGWVAQTVMFRLGGPDSHL